LWRAELLCGGDVPEDARSVRLCSDVRQSGVRQPVSVSLPTWVTVDAEVSSVVRGLTITTKPNVQITAGRALQMLTDYAGLRIVRHPMQPLQRRVFELRHNFTAYDAMYVALAEALDVPLLTDDGKFAATPGHRADIHAYPD
jgi:predicted nucleic acid-binding protein